MARTIRAAALESTEDNQRQEDIEGIGINQEPSIEATDEQKEQVQEKADNVGSQNIETLAGLITIETGLNAQVVKPLKVSDEDKKLVAAALDVLAEVIERKVTTESTKRYLGLLLMFIRSALTTQM